MFVVLGSLVVIPLA